MEVHHHPHPGKKKFAEYLLEGLMIFIAVMLGFIAENIRESISESNKGKEYVESFVQNLRADTTGITEVIKENKEKIEGLKKLMSFAHSDLSNTETRTAFYKACGSSISYYSLFKSNDATMQQLKNSGALRFIRKSHAADSIARYDVEINAIYEAATLYNQATDKGINASHEILEYAVYYDSSYYTDHQFTGKPLPLLTTDHDKQQLFFNSVVFEIGATQNYINNLVSRKPMMIGLLNFLKKEYRIE